MISELYFIYICIYLFALKIYVLYIFNGFFLNRNRRVLTFYQSNNHCLLFGINFTFIFYFNSLSLKLLYLFYIRCICLFYFSPFLLIFSDYFKCLVFLSFLTYRLYLLYLCSVFGDCSKIYSMQF